jgi:hypothetical protein
MNERPEFGIYQATAHIDDADGLAKLLSPALDPETIAALVATREAGWAGRYGAIARSADVVTSDGRIVVRFTVFGVSEEDADAIFHGCETLIDWTAQAFHDMVNAALGTNYVRAQ